MGEVMGVVGVHRAVREVVAQLPVVRSVGVVEPHGVSASRTVESLPVWSAEPLPFAIRRFDVVPQLDRAALPDGVSPVGLGDMVYQVPFG
jgi:hypothetical protein